MKPLAIIYILILSLEVALANERIETGIVEKMDENLMVINHPSGSQGHIGFLCDPEICKLTRNIFPGDKILITLGAVDRKTKLLNIRKCISEDVECRRAAEEEIEQTKKKNEASRVREKEHRECRKKMDDELKSDIRNIPEKLPELTFDYNKFTDDYREILNNPVSRQCVLNIKDAQYDAFIEACEEHGCGDSIGGGCYHIAGYTRFEAAEIYAVEQCRN